jgi:hypothetical protein
MILMGVVLSLTRFFVQWPVGFFVNVIDQMSRADPYVSITIVLVEQPYCSHRTDKSSPSAVTPSTHITSFPLNSRVVDHINTSPHLKLYLTFPLPTNHSRRFPSSPHPEPTSTKLNQSTPNRFGSNSTPKERKKNRTGRDS